MTAASDWAMGRAREVERAVRALVFDRGSGSRALVLSEEDAVEHIADALDQARAEALAQCAALVEGQALARATQECDSHDVLRMELAHAIRALEDRP